MYPTFLFVNRPAPSISLMQTKSVTLAPECNIELVPHLLQCVVLSRPKGFLFAMAQRFEFFEWVVIRDGEVSFENELCLSSSYF